GRRTWRCSTCSGSRTSSRCSTRTSRSAHWPTAGKRGSPSTNCTHCWCTLPSSVVATAARPAWQHAPPWPRLARAELVGCTEVAVSSAPVTNPCAAAETFPGRPSARAPAPSAEASCTQLIGQERRELRIGLEPVGAFGQAVALVVVYQQFAWHAFGVQRRLDLL